MSITGAEAVFTDENLAGSGAPVSKRHSRPVSARLAAYAALAPALVSIAICVYQLGLPNVLYGVHEYDDGVYMAAALRLLNGSIPYRDFVIVHPPGIVLLMAPVALVGRLFGSDVSLALARDLTALVTALNVVLAGVAVRHRGRVAALIAGTALACFPMAPAADSTLFLEPYLVFFCLLGLILMFSEGRLASRRRLLMAGVAFGLAGSVKVWAGFVFAAAVLVCLRKARQALWPVLAGCAAGFVVPCLPFFVMALRNFIRDVFGDQFARTVTGTAVFSWADRVLYLTGLTGLTIFKTPRGIAVAAAVLCVAVVGVAFRRGRASVLPADWMILLASAGAVIAMWLPNAMYAHYVYFSAPFLGMLLAVVASLLIPASDSRTWRRAVALGCATAMIFLIPQQMGYARSNLAAATNPTFLNIMIPPNACVVTDKVAVTVAADLFTPNGPGCPDVVDPFGTWLAEGPAQEPVYDGTSGAGTAVEVPAPAPFVNEWARWLSQADYFIALAPFSGYIPWTPQLRAWFGSNFKLMSNPEGLWIYQHKVRTPPPVDR